MSIEELRRQVEEGRSALADLEARLHRAEQQERDQRWFPQGFYTAYYILGGMVLGVIASWATLLFHVAGALLVGEPALKLLRVYSTILGGARTAESSEAVVLVFALGVHTLTGAVCGAPLHAVYSRFFMGQDLKRRLLSGLWLGLVMWLVNFYGILWWLQPLLLGESRSSIVDTIPVWLAALTHVAFTEIMLLLQPLAVFNARSYTAAHAAPPAVPAPGQGRVSMLTLCLHCGLPAGAVGRAGEVAFCCYGCRLAHQLSHLGEASESPGGRAASSALTRLLLAGFFAMASMTFSVALYASACYPAAAGWSHALGPLAPVMQWLAVAFAAPVIALLGGPLLFHAISGRQRREGTTAVNALIVAGVAAAYGLSIINLVRGEGEVYVETAVMLLVLITLGRYLDARARERTHRAMLDLLSADPQHAWRLDPAALDAAPARVPIAAVRSGDLVRVAAGERMPVDGTVVSGSAAADEAVLTGESEPRELAAGDPVRAGALLVDGRVDVRATAALGDRLLDRIARLTVEAREHRMPLERLGAVISTWFLPLSLLVSIAAGAAAARQSGAGAGVLRALAVLLISCPCALGIATPLAAWVAIGRAARRGVLVRGSDALEKLARARRIFLDKTGTLTSRELVLAGTIAAPGVTVTRLLETAAALASLSSHPGSTAIARRAASEGLALRPAERFQAFPGLGLAGDVDGKSVLLGSARFIARQTRGALDGEWVLPPGFEGAGDLSWVHVAVDNRAIGVFALEEALRPEALAAIAALRGLGFTVEVLTGDTPARGRRLEERVGIPVHAGLLPPDKVDHLCRARRRGETVVMVGDGHNDAPVIAAADVGMALGGGTEIARDTADIVLLESRGEPLLGIAYAVELARTTVRRIRLNLFWAFGYNACGMVLGAAGLVHPLLATCLMIASSLFVVFASTAEERAPSRAPISGARVPAGRPLPRVAPC